MEPPVYQFSLCRRPTVEEVLADPCSSWQLRAAITAALQRDPVDATNDAEVLLAILSDRLEKIQPTTSTASSGGE